MEPLPATELDALKERVRAALEDERVQDARSLLRAASAQQALDSEHWLLLGHLDALSDDASAAYDCFTQALTLNPDNAEAHINAGIALESLQRLEDALHAYQDAVRCNTHSDEAHYRSGNILRAVGQLDAAEAAYRAALTVNPSHLRALNNLGALFYQRANHAAALDCYQAALALQPGEPEVLYNIANLRYCSRDYPQAAADYRQALERIEALSEAPRQWIIDPTSLKADCHQNLAAIASAQGAHDEAIAHYRTVLTLWPDHAPALHFLAALGALPVAPRASDDYVTKLFDTYADNFDQHLTQQLQYRMPQLLCGQIQKKLGATTGALEVIDLGCGSGLCGPLLRPMARTLTGIDLSTRMIEKARARGEYDHLHVGEIVAVLTTYPTAHFHLAVATDVLIYFGALEELFAACRRVLKPGGWLGVSIERTTTYPHVLNLTGRYAHHKDYLAECARGSGFKLVKLTAADIRKETGKPVHGFIALLRALPAASATA